MFCRPDVVRNRHRRLWTSSFSPHIGVLDSSTAIEDQYEEFSDGFHRSCYGEEYRRNVLVETEQAIIEEARILIGREPLQIRRRD